MLLKFCLPCLPRKTGVYLVECSDSCPGTGFNRVPQLTGRRLTGQAFGVFYLGKILARLNISTSNRGLSFHWSHSTTAILYPDKKGTGSFAAEDLKSFTVCVRQKCLSACPRWMRQSCAQSVAVVIEIKKIFRQRYFTLRLAQEISRKLLRVIKVASIFSWHRPLAFVIMSRHRLTGLNCL